jgi:hypothetical protein
MQHMKSLAVTAALAVLVCPVFAEDSALAVTNAYRTSVGVTTTYRTGSAKTSVELPDQLKNSLMFAFDCMKTNGWEFNASGGVLKIPNLVSSGPHAERFLTMKSADVVDPYYFSSYRIYYGAASTCKPGTFVAEDPDGVLKGPFIDFGFVGSKQGLFFNQASHPWSRTVSGTVHSGETANIMKNIGTIVGVYKSNMGSEPTVNKDGHILFKDGGGSILAGADFNRFIGYDADSDGVNNNGAGLKRPLVIYNLKSDLKGAWAWTGLQKGAPYTTFWTGGWQTFAATPAAATLSANGVGLGNVMGTDASATSGGQSIAELMIFDRVLSDDETREVLYHLERKWLGKTYAGRNGRSEMTTLTLRDGSESAPAEPISVTLDVPEGELMQVGSIAGGRYKEEVKPQVVKTGDGVMTPLTHQVSAAKSRFAAARSDCPR